MSKWTQQDIVCGYCQNISKMTTLNEYFHDLTNGEWIDMGDGFFAFDPNYEGGIYYLTQKCPSCNKINICSQNWYDGMDDFIDKIETNVLYPKKVKLQGMPDIIQKIYDITERVKGIDLDTYVSLSRKIIEQICKIEGGIGKDLKEKINDLANKGVFPQNISKLAHQIRFLGNIGTHEIGAISEEEASIIENLVDLICTYTYTTQHLLNITQKKIDQINTLRPKS